jgi:hypothetical protein
VITRYFWQSPRRSPCRTQQFSSTAAYATLHPERATGFWLVCLSVKFVFRYSSLHYFQSLDFTPATSPAVSLLYCQITITPTLDALLLPRHLATPAICPQTRASLHASCYPATRFTLSLDLDICRRRSLFPLQPLHLGSLPETGQRGLGTQPLAASPSSQVCLSRSRSAAP